MINSERLKGFADRLMDKGHLIATKNFSLKGDNKIKICVLINLLFQGVEMEIN